MKVKLDNKTHNFLWWLPQHLIDCEVRMHFYITQAVEWRFMVLINIACVYKVIGGVDLIHWICNMLDIKIGTLYID